jgi:hypothetical protein
LVDLVQKSTAFRERFPNDAWLGIIISLHIPPICRGIDYCFPALNQQFPERFGVIDTAGKAAADSYNGDSVFLHKLGAGSRTLTPGDHKTYSDYSNQLDGRFFGGWWQAAINSRLFRHTLTYFLDGEIRSIIRQVRP